MVKKEKPTPIVYDDIVKLLETTILVRKTFVERAQRYLDDSRKRLRKAERELKKYQRTGILDLGVDKK